MNCRIFGVVYQTVKGVHGDALNSCGARGSLTCPQQELTSWEARNCTSFCVYNLSSLASSVSQKLRACSGRRTRPILATKALTNFTCLRYEGPGISYFFCRDGRQTSGKGGLVRFRKLRVAGVNLRGPRSRKKAARHGKTAAAFHAQTRSFGVLGLVKTVGKGSV